MNGISLPLLKLDKRVWLLATAGLIIGGLCVFRANRTYPPPAPVAPRAIAEPAPPFELYDQSSPSRLVRLITYLGRNPVIVVFFDGNAGANRSAVLSRLREQAARLREAGVYIMAISTALPQQNRKTAAKYGDYPFPLLSDPGFHVQQEWGRVEGKNAKTHSGVFLVDRKGAVAWSRETDTPQPLSNWEATVAGLIKGR